MACASFRLSLLTSTVLAASLALLGCSGVKGTHGSGDNGGGGGGSGDAGADTHDASPAVDSASVTEAGPSMMTTCAAPSACGSNGITTQECTVTNTAGACAQLLYRTSDGHQFDCASCSSCTAAQEQLSAYCAQATAMPTTTCATPSACGATGTTYDLCTTTSAAGECTGKEYRTSGGASYTCASCADCSAALAEVTAQCTTTTCTLPTACTASTTYDVCTTTDVGGTCTAKTYETSDGKSYACVSCTDCAAAEASIGSVCTSTACSGSTPCGAGGAAYETCTTEGPGQTCTQQYYLVPSTGAKFTCSSCASCSVAASQLSGYCASLTSAPRVVLFGGRAALAATGLNDTWTFDGTSWVQLSPTTPPSARYWSSAATMGAELVVFGGDNGTAAVSETWAFGGAAWSAVSTATAPTPRDSPAMATLGSRVVVFGGYDGTSVLGDTWTFDGATWTESTATGPAARSDSAMATLGSKVVLFGGDDATGVALNDTWTFDGSAWAQVTVTTPPPVRDGFAMTSLGSKVVLFGGYSGAASLNDTWTFDGTTWTQVTVTTPPAARNGHAMGSLGTKAVLFGGYNTVTLGDTWIFDGVTWTQSTAVGPSARNNQVMAAFP
jgi:N-acetylneuraminic acid mutarotase